MSSSEETGFTEPDGALTGALAGVTVESRREQLGRLVRETWVAWASERPDAKPSWLIPWQKLDSAEGQREVDMRIGEAVAAAERERIAAAAGRLTAALERPAENVVVWNRCDTCEALEDRAEAAEAALADAVAAERERIRQLAIRNQAVCAGEDGTSCWFSALIPSPGEPVEAAGPRPAVVTGIPAVGDAEIGRLRGDLAAQDGQLARIREIAEDWIAGHDYAEYQTVETAIRAECGRVVLAVMEGGEAGPGTGSSAFWLMVTEDGGIALAAPCADTLGCLWGATFGEDRVSLGALIAAAAQHTGMAAGKIHARLGRMTGDDGPPNNGRPVVHSAAVAPGGWVCAAPVPGNPDDICGNPVESEPCNRHGEVSQS